MCQSCTEKIDLHTQTHQRRASVITQMAFPNADCGGSMMVPSLHVHYAGDGGECFRRRAASCGSVDAGPLSREHCGQHRSAHGSAPEQAHQCNKASC